MAIVTVFRDKRAYTQIDIKGRGHPLLIRKKKGKRWKFYKPTFNGKHNSLKCKVLYVLYEAYEGELSGGGGGGGSRWLTAKEIQARSGCNYKSLLTRLPLYNRWLYVRSLKRRYGFKRYSIGKAGRVYFDKYKGVMPLARYEREIKEWRAVNE